VFSQHASYAKTRNLRIRPVPEMGICFVFTPARPKLYTLNTSAWLVLALCDGRRGRALVDAYAEEMAPHLSRDDALGEVRDAVRDLELKGIVARVQDRG
jgi:hypothetical protein